ncbi:hypothetical protein [Spirulina subsalsa]|uniref:hypothetical protein n=1 Tax=Spirulina subsalsa TaxID=54311 RepID=UPI0013E0A61F|nr:hypothetical protein [Spirulina subsalsa]
MGTSKIIRNFIVSVFDLHFNHDLKVKLMSCSKKIAIPAQIPSSGFERTRNRSSKKSVPHQTGKGDKTDNLKLSSLVASGVIKPKAIKIQWHPPRYPKRYPDFSVLAHFVSVPVLDVVFS